MSGSSQTGRWIRLDSRQNRYSRLYDLAMLGTALLYLLLQA